MLAAQFNLLKAYKFAKSYVMKLGFGKEINWQKNTRVENMEESDFLRESAWVVLCAGMKESIVRKYFRNITLCFFEWQSAEKIVEMKKYCIEYAMKFFNNHRKISAIAEIAEHVVNIGFDKLKTILQEKPIAVLRTFPFMGPVTSYHLAKNLGLPFAKPDRHLTRISYSLGYTSVQDFCVKISKESGDPVPVVDIVLWRFATLRKDYISEFLRRSRE